MTSAPPPEPEIDDEARSEGGAEPEAPAKSKGGGEGGPPPNATRLVVGFTWRFLLAVAVLSTLSYVDEQIFSGAAIEFLTTHVATGVVSTMTAFGFPATSDANQIFYENHAFKIVEECVGLEVLELYAAAVLAFPVSWRSRLRGIGTGLPILFSINFVRMITLVFLGAKSKQALQIGHLYVWPLIVIAVAIGLWLTWAWSTNDETRPGS